jgi:hypothetical protein
MLDALQSCTPFGIFAISDLGPRNRAGSSFVYVSLIVRGLWDFRIGSVIHMNVNGALEPKSWFIPTPW